LEQGDASGVLKKACGWFSNQRLASAPLRGDCFFPLALRWNCRMEGEEQGRKTAYNNHPAAAAGSTIRGDHSIALKS